MKEMNTINVEALEDVIGGAKRTVNTGTKQNAAVRVKPGVSSKQVGSLPNGTKVNATGAFKRAGGRNWAQINAPVKGWIKASIIGYAR